MESCSSWRVLGPVIGNKLEVPPAQLDFWLQFSRNKLLGSGSVPPRELLLLGLRGVEPHLKKAPLPPCHGRLTVMTVQNLAVAVAPTQPQVTKSMSRVTPSRG